MSAAMIRIPSIAILISAMVTTAAYAQQSPSGKQSDATAVTRAVGGAKTAESAVRPAAGETGSVGSRRGGGGILGNWLGGGKSKSSEESGRRVIEPAPPSGEPDWSGVPFHKPHASTSTAANQPIQDPRDPSNRIASAARPTQSAAAPTATSTPTASKVPVPPSESGNGTARRTGAAPAATVEAPRLDTKTYEPLSATESSRRSNRKSVSPLETVVASPSDLPSSTEATDSLDTSDVSESTAASARRNASNPLDAEPQPRVARRTLPTLPIQESATNRAGARGGAADVPPSLNLPPTVTSGREEVRKEVSGSASNTVQDSWTTGGIGSAKGSTTAIGQPIEISPAATSNPVMESTPRVPELTTSSPKEEPKRVQPLGVTPRADTGQVDAIASTNSVVNSLPVNTGNEIPGIRVVTSGPSQIAVNQLNTYKITLENRGSLDAPGAMVQIALPRWITVQSQIASRGEIEKEEQSTSKELLWLVQGLPAGAVETITLQLLATEAKEFDVEVEFALVPQSTSSRVVVMEPKLELVIEGPDQVVFGESQTYKVRVLNPGTGVAEGVVFTLSPNSATPQTQRIGTIAPGKEAQFEVELSAQDLESLQIHGLAVAELGLKMEQTKTIEVIAAQLQAILSGPSLQYQDSVATYQLQLENSGKANCSNVVASLKLPSGVLYQGGIEGAAMVGDQLQWQIPQIPGLTKLDYTFTCQLQKTGEQQLVFQCQGSAAGTTNVSFITQVDALADLVLTINDPPAPAPVGSEVVYEVIIRNRGSKAASDVEVAAKFGFDIEPVRIDGALGKIEPGLVYFDKIARIEAGAEVKLRVFAKAEKPGLHGFRTEVRCGDTLLVSEESTRYMQVVGEHVSRRSDEASKK